MYRAYVPAALFDRTDSTTAVSKFTEYATPLSAVKPLVTKRGVTSP